MLQFKRLYSNVLDVGFQGCKQHGLPSPFRGRKAFDSCLDGRIDEVFRVSHRVHVVESGEEAQNDIGASQNMGQRGFIGIVDLNPLDAMLVDARALGRLAMVSRGLAHHTRKQTLPSAPVWLPGACSGPISGR